MLVKITFKRIITVTINRLSCHIYISKKSPIVNTNTRNEKFALFSISGFTDRLLDLTRERGDLLLFGGDGKLTVI